MPSPVPAPPRDATSTRRGLMGITAQTFAGVKTFLEAIGLAKKTAGTLPVGGTELEGAILYNTTTKRAMVHDGTGWVPVVMSTGSTESLEEHLLDVENAHDATAINYSGGTHVEAALDELDTTRVRRNDVSDPWVDATTTTDEGWTGTASCLVGDDKRVMLKGSTTRSNSDYVKGIPFQLPVEARPARSQVKFVQVYTSATSYIVGIINIQTTGHIQIMNEPASGWTNPVIGYTGVEYSLI